ncbi:MAG: class D sortase [Clostridia bacterium]|nr:class D sortase [Clostridia bacterium]
MSSKIQEIIAQIEDSNYTSIKQPNDIEQQETLQNTEKTNNMKKIKEDEKINNEPQKNSQDFVWQIQIPAINLNALIAEGTSKEVMDEFVGHFEETVKRNGNIGLAAHNRGYKVNYFQNLKKLKEGDEIIYKYKEFEKRYVVKTLKIISDEDWSLLENTEDNRITLITCVENEPQYRRAVQAIEV